MKTNLQNKIYLFFADDFQSGVCYLGPGESEHCVRVLRLRQGDRISVTNGKGTLFNATLLNVDAKKCSAVITEQKENHGKRDYHLHIALAPTKNIDRTEWFIEKAVEMGVGEITPVLCDHSERTVWKPERAGKIMLSALKQSLQTYLPALNPVEKLSGFLSREHSCMKFIAHFNETKNKHLKDIYIRGNDALIVIGPEGDFSDDELLLAGNHGFIQINLGKTRLRTETAALAACHTINLLNE